jgi:hypothetical protein
MKEYGKMYPQKAARLSPSVLSSISQMQSYPEPIENKTD